MRRLRQRARYEDGFTLVEVVVAIVIILVGVLGTVVLIDRANSATSETKTRQTANNIMRDLVDTAQGLPYSSLTTTGLVPAVQARGFADSVTSTTAWEITRNGTTYTVTANVCVVDDPNDGSQNSHPSSSNFCSDSPAGVGDTNGDDYRRVTFTLAPPTGLGAPITAATVVGQNRTTNIGGSGSGGGNASIDITSMKIDTGAGKTTLYSGQVARCPGSFLSSSCPAGIYGNGPTASTVWPKQVYFVATTASTAQKVKFAVDGKVYQTVPGPATTFSSTWTLPDNQPDGTYTVTAQVFDSSGNSALSDPKPVTTILNRYLPDPNAFAATAAGRNHLYPQGSTGFGYPEVETYPSNTAGARVDRDVVGFQTMRYVGSATGVLACSTNSVLLRSCQDTGAPNRSTSTTLRYRILPYAYNADGTQQIGNGNPPVSLDVNLANARPCTPRSLSATRSGTVVTLTWLPPTTGGTCTQAHQVAGGDPDSPVTPTTTSDCIEFYRVYTKSAGLTAFAFGDRSERTPFGVARTPCGAAGEASTSITLWETSATPKSYQLTAVDTKLNESIPITPSNGCGSSC
jgi:prepilin-type N-terminal cleavage/methylation domain-containing protein